MEIACLGFFSKIPWYMDIAPSMSPFFSRNLAVFKEAFIELVFWVDTLENKIREIKSRLFIFINLF